MVEQPKEMPGTAVPTAAVWLGGAGLLPFFGSAVVMLLGPADMRELAEVALLTYGAIILSFMGGCRFGLAAAGMGEGPDFSSLTLAVVPALYAWIAAMIGGWVAMMLLAMALLSLLAADIALTRRGGAPLWWPRLRWPLTLGAVTALLIGAAA
ncbi:MAG: DUF3429 domain-containing protein [Pseudomonadota bacterium]